MVNKGNLRNYMVFYCFLFILSAFSTVLASQLLQTGSRGSAVIEVQEYLYRLNYLKTKPTGYYGQETTEAVKVFQMEHGLKVDGKVGSMTLAALKEKVSQKNTVIKHTVAAEETLQDIAQKYNSTIVAIMAKNNLQSESIVEGQVLVIPQVENKQLLSSRGRGGVIQAVPWPIVEQLWRRGEIARITDLDTGKSFAVRRHGGHYHSDTEPLTVEDTRTMLEIYGGRWSWERRAVIIQIRNQYIAASINGMPHGRKSISDNGFKGHFCVHFLGSRLHKNGRMDNTHQMMVNKAVASNMQFQTERPVTGETSIPVPETRTPETID